MACLTQIYKQTREGVWQHLFGVWFGGRQHLQRCVCCYFGVPTDTHTHFISIFLFSNFLLAFALVKLYIIMYLFIHTLFSQEKKNSSNNIKHAHSPKLEFIAKVFFISLDGHPTLFCPTKVASFLHRNSPQKEKRGCTNSRPQTIFHHHHHHS